MVKIMDWDVLVARVCGYLGVEVADLRVVVEDVAAGQVVVVLGDFRKVKIATADLPALDVTVMPAERLVMFPKSSPRRKRIGR